jgi:hypothetical protein
MSRSSTALRMRISPTGSAIGTLCRGKCANCILSQWKGSPQAFVPMFVPFACTIMSAHDHTQFMKVLILLLRGVRVYTWDTRKRGCHRIYTLLPLAARATGPNFMNQQMTSLCSMRVCAPHFIQTTWAYALVGLFVVEVSWFSVKWRVSVPRKRV